MVVPSSPARAPSIRTLQTVLLAMIVGLVTFAALACVLPLEHPLDAALARVLALALGALAVAEVPAYLLLRTLQIRRLGARRAEALEELRQGATPPEVFLLVLLGAALAESIGLFGCLVLYLGRLLPALIAPALAVLLIALQIPTRDRAESLVRRASEG